MDGFERIIMDESAACSSLLDELGVIARRWLRHCGRPGGADCTQQWANDRADNRVKECVKDIQTLIHTYRGVPKSEG
jgi:hypothetical protein